MLSMMTNRLSTPPSPPRRTSPPPGHPSTRCVSEIVVIPRSLALNAAEEALSSLTLVAMVGGTCPPVSSAAVRTQLESFYNISVDAFTVSRYSPEDFLVCFYNRDDLEEVVQASVPLGIPFYLI